MDTDNDGKDDQWRYYDEKGFLDKCAQDYNQYQKADGYYYYRNNNLNSKLE